MSFLYESYYEDLGYNSQTTRKTSSRHHQKQPGGKCIKTLKVELQI